MGYVTKVNRQSERPLPNLQSLRMQMRKLFRGRQ
jgi:hypothetical protein